jgi:hypothetical protein
MQKKWLSLALFGLCWSSVSFLYITAVEAIELVTVQPLESNTINTTNKDIDNGFKGDSQVKSEIIIFENLESSQEQNQTQRSFQIGPASVEKSFTTKTSFNYLELMPERYNAAAIQIDTPINSDSEILPIIFSISYAQEILESTLVPYRWDSENNLAPSGLNNQMNTSHVISIGLSYSSDDFIDASVSSSYSLEQYQVHSSEKVKYLSYEFSLSFWPNENISITPSVNFTENRFAYWDEEGTKTTSASLNITFYELLDQIDLSLSQYYSQTKDYNGYEDGRVLNTSLEMNWDLEYIFSRQIMLFLELGQENYKYNIYPEESYKSIYSSFLLNIPF